MASDRLALVASALSEETRVLAITATTCKPAFWQSRLREGLGGKLPFWLTRLRETWREPKGWLKTLRIFRLLV